MLVLLLSFCFSDVDSMVQQSQKENSHDVFDGTSEGNGENHGI